MKYLITCVAVMLLATACNLHEYNSTKVGEIRDFMRQCGPDAVRVKIDDKSVTPRRMEITCNPPRVKTPWL